MVDDAGSPTLLYRGLRPTILRSSPIVQTRADTEATAMARAGFDLAIDAFVILRYIFVYDMTVSWGFENLKVMVDRCRGHRSRYRFRNGCILPVRIC